MKRSYILVILAAVALAVICVLAWLMLHGGAAGPYGAQQPSAVTGPSPGPTVPPTQTAPKTAPPPAAAGAPVTKKAGKQPPLPPLVPGNSLTDEKFAEVSAQIVIAAVGLKQDKDWEANLNAYIEQELERAKVGEEQFMEYRDALEANPERGRAVAESILRKVEKRLGYRMSIENMPMLKLDPAQKQQLEKASKKK